MSERRYTVTEGQLIELVCFVTDPMSKRKTLSDLLDEWLDENLAPDPEPSGEVVDGVLQIIDQFGENGESLGDGSLKKRLSSFLTTEVTRQVEERTKGYREALEKIAHIGDNDPDCNHCGEYLMARHVARQALANKGGS